MENVPHILDYLTPLLCDVFSTAVHYVYGPPLPPYRFLQLDIQQANDRFRIPEPLLAVGNYQQVLLAQQRYEELRRRRRARIDPNGIAATTRSETLQTENPHENWWGTSPSALQIEYQELAPPIPVRELHKEVIRKSLEQPCYVCYTDFADAKEAVWCRGACGQNIHFVCWKKWSAERVGKDITCAFCRARWVF